MESGKQGEGNVIRKAATDYLQLPSHRQIGIWREMEYPESYDNSISAHDNNLRFIKWISENKKQEKFLELFGYTPQPSAQSYKQAGVWVKATLANKKEDFPHKNIPEIGKEVFCKVNGVKFNGWLEEFKVNDVVVDYLLTFNGKHGDAQYALSNAKSFEWLDESLHPLGQGEWIDELVQRHQTQIARYYNVDKTDEERKVRNAIIEEYKDLISTFKSKLNQ